MNMETVKPMPVSMQTLKKFFQLQPWGSWTNPNLTASQENENTPTNFPTANPKKDCQTYAVEQTVHTDAFQVHSCIGECEDRNHEIVDGVL